MNESEVTKVLMIMMAVSLMFAVSCCKGGTAEKTEGRPVAEIIWLQASFLPILCEL